MSAELVTFNPSETLHRNERAKALEDRFYNSYRIVEKSAVNAGLRVDGGSELNQWLYSAHAWKDFWERQTKRLDRTIRGLLASDNLTAEQRAMLIASLHGAAPGFIVDPRLLTVFERRIIEQYRATDTAGKQMLRTLCQRLAQTRSEGINGA